MRDYWKGYYASQRENITNKYLIENYSEYWEVE
jgi:hypothetical protein